MDTATKHIVGERPEASKRSAMLAWLLAAFCLVGSVAGLIIWLAQLTTTPTLAEWAEAFGWRLLLPVSFSIVAALIISRQPRNLVGWLLMIPALVMAAPLAGSSSYFLNPPADPGLPFFIYAWFNTWGWILLIFPIILIPLHFPDGKPPSGRWHFPAALSGRETTIGRWRWVDYLALFLALLFICLATMAEAFGGDVAGIPWRVPNPIGFIPMSWEPYFIPVWGIALVSLVLLSTSSLFVRYRQANVVERTQIKWLLYAASLFTVVYALTFIAIPLTQSVFWHSVLVLLTLLGIPAAIGIAILRFHLFDIDLVINRSLVYGGLTLAVVGIYVAVVGYLSFLFQTEANLAISLVATGLVAVLFGHLRGWLQRGVNRLMYGQRDEPYQVLTQLGEKLETTVDPAQTLQLTAATIAGSLKLPYVAIHMQRNGSRRTAATFGATSNETTHFSLIHGGEEIGELEAAERSPNEPLAAADIRLLNDLARQISPTVGASLLALDLEEARLRIVTAREESRRQLGSDLHDGIGHQLAGLARKIEQANTLLGNDPQAVAGILAEINRQLNATSDEVRQLAYRLHPPELELLGLAGALRERAGAVTTLAVRLDVAGNLPQLSAAVETAVYYIALEALTNVEKHAGAQNCTVRLSLTEQDSSFIARGLQLHIEDDGRGWPAQRGNGLGLLSMQGRAAEVGGTCQIERSPQGGLQVAVHLPLPGEQE